MCRLIPTTTLLFLLPAALLVAGPNGRGPGKGCACAAVTGVTTPLTLSAPAMAALRFQIDEERMARELYTAFGNKWDLRPFRNIVQAEERHEAVLQALAKRAGLAVAEAAPGRFATAEVQERYDSLMTRGMTSATDALQAGAFVEEHDIADLRTLAGTTDSAELKQAVSALERASAHHLAAFVRNLGASYTAQVLPAADVAALTDGTGRGGNGCGRGFGAGRRATF